jgi:tellurite methyltransferase
VSHTDQERWDKKWRAHDGGDEAPVWLVQHAHLLDCGVAVDLATGRGGAACWLAARGYRVLAVDVSRVALNQARTASRPSGPDAPLFVEADLDDWRLSPASADLITVFRFLDRALFPMIRAAVRPGGLLVYQTRTVGWLEREPGASVEFLLRRGELLLRFGDWQVAGYLEDKAHAAIVARKPDSVVTVAPMPR